MSNLGSGDSTSQPRTGSVPRGRRDGIDFWRGLILCMIFINHVPGNLFEKLTFKNFGFSDSSEAFVFISGLSLALAYAHRFRNGGEAAVLGSLARRAVKLYGAHIALSLVGLLIFAVGAALAQNPELMQVHGRDLFVDDPAAALVGLVSLGHQLGYFNILPMYILLIAMVPGLFWLARKSRLAMLAASFALYLLARLNGWNIPNWPMKGQWFFDPFAWQFLMATGIAAGFHLRTVPFPRNRILLGLSAAVVVTGAFCATDGFATLPGLNETVRAWIDLDKTTLGVGRIVHFLGLAYLVHGLGLAHLMRHAVWFKPLCLIGRNGLWTFGLLSLLAAVGQVLAESLGHTPALDIGVIVGGLAILYGAAVLRDERRNGFVPAYVASGRG